ncbi:hypothetical protein R1479_03948 [Ralstonia mannitolilytica]|uniref:hypothetical protein n=1 Tax=Ralstonia mannitolilytica TaxID=105219 RepID=UPI0028F6443E|nr:hypothetical protein [Ralstonia mannitolilytica]CAJ0895440.1 hypothetical protein R1479_03948 [Ralstonia mannitolilytica]
MLSFATEFPVEADRTTVDFLQAMVTWISGSPHTGLSAEMLRDLLQKDEAHVENGKEKVQSLLATSPDVDLAGTPAEFDAFGRSLLVSRDWLRGKGGGTGDGYLCVEVTAPGRPYLYVNPEGGDYARYVARLG